nr:MAG: RNA-dependent RNA polymerase [Rhizoctonia solani mitovirus 96]
MKLIINNFISLKAIVINTLKYLDMVSIRTLKAIFRPRRPRISSPLKWIRMSEFKRYAITVAWITNTMHLKKSYILLLERVSNIWTSCSSTWAFAYMKEVLRLTVRALAGSPELVNYNGSIRVKRDRYGVPTIIPLHLRYIIHGTIERDCFFEYAIQRRSLIGILTIVNVFRMLPTKVKPSLDSIVKPFDGQVMTLNEELIFKSLNSVLTPIKGGRPHQLILGSFDPHITGKSGPNGPYSTWGASIDALAFIHEPRQLYLLVRWMFLQGAYGYIGLLLFLLLAFGWIYYIFYLTGLCKKLYLGKLSVVYDQAGKARVVAITNWWFQSAFGGLHSSIFRLLETISQDGTFDQDGTFNKFLTRANPFEDLSGYDLSAATDRLPLELQMQILSACGLPGDIWGALLRNVRWAFPNKEGLPDQVSYAVGQPMGALSSWAMLALTHHVIVRYSALLAGMNKPQYVNYAVLGDDCVINNNAVAKEYLALMTDLGLSISMGKSVVSKRFTEFAKLLKGPAIDISPFGAGEITSAFRSSYFIPALLMKAIRIFQLSAEEVLDLVRAIPASILDRVRTGALARLSIWHSFINNSWVHEVSLLDAKTLKRYSNFFSAQIALFPEALLDTMYRLAYVEIERKLDNAHEQLTNFLMEALSTFSARTWPLRLLEFLMKPYNPGFWIYLFDGFEAIARTEEAFVALDKYREYKSDPLAGIRYIRTLDPRINGLDLKTLVTRKEAAKAAGYYFRVYDGMQSRIIM